ncbi:MAG: hypothetical protein IE885_04660 [Campylobacterales bacterium]|nr:hypothetical protein [Campylobacterales bacterium]
MKKVVVFFALGVSLLVMTPTTLQAVSGVDQGQKIFKKHLRKACGFSGVRFARQHTQDEWEEIYEEGKFPEEAKNICPRLDLKKIKPSWWQYIYEFTYEYGVGGAHIPKC